MITPRTGFIRYATIIALLAGVAFASQAEAAVLRVFVVKTDNVSAYVKEVAKGEVLRKRLQLHANLRVWRARFAGSDTGSVVVSIENPSLAVLAQEEAKGLTDPKYAAWLSGLDKIRTIVSDSTYDELKPESRAG
jgi:hypothetical protein